MLYSSQVKVRMMTAATMAKTMASSQSRTSPTFCGGSLFGSWYVAPFDKPSIGRYTQGNNTAKNCSQKP